MAAKDECGDMAHELLDAGIADSQTNPDLPTHRSMLY